MRARRLRATLLAIAVAALVELIGCAGSGCESARPASGGGVVTQQTIDAGDAGAFELIQLTGYDAGRVPGY